MIAWNQFNDPTTVDLLTGGGAGSSKSFLMCIIMVLCCRDYPGVVLGLGRKEMKRLKQTTVVTLINKVHPYLGVQEHEFRYKSQEGVIEYTNGSKIVLVDMAYQPSDPDFDTFGSLEFTHVFIEEVGEIHMKAVEVLSTRKNRMLNKEYGIVGKTYMTCNPSKNFLRQDYYLPFKKLEEENGNKYIQRWKRGNVFLADGRKVDAYRAFVRSTAFDNPFIDPNYIEELRTKKPQERKRLLEGDWNYTDDDDSLFPSMLLDKGTAYTMPEPQYNAQGQILFNKFIGVDVADKGKDDTVVTLIENGVVTHQKTLIIDKTRDEETGQEKKSAAIQYTDELIKFAQQHGFTIANSRNIFIEGNGVGVGMKTAMVMRGWNASIFENTTSNRAWGYYNMSLDMDDGSFKVLMGIDDGELARQLGAHTYTYENNTPRLITKEKLKKELGRSPDNADSLMIANWGRRGGVAQADPKANQSRVVF